MDQILKEKKSYLEKELTVAQARNSSDRHKKEGKVERKNIIISPSIAPGIKIIDWNSDKVSTQYHTTADKSVKYPCKLYVNDNPTWFSCPAKYSYDG